MQTPLSPLFGHARPNVRPDEAASALCITTAQVRELHEQGWLAGFDIGDDPDPLRRHMRYTRASVEGFFAHRCARNGTPLYFELSHEAKLWLNHLKTTQPQTNRR